MKKFIQNKLKDQKGLTLIELLAVIVIIAIIAAIAIPAIGNIIENSRVGTMKSDNLNAIAAAELFLLDNPGTTTVTLGDIAGAEATTGAGGAAVAAKPGGYLNDKGSLLTFSYTKADGKVASTAKQGSMKLDITGATKSQINGYKNSNRTAENTITASKAE